MRIKNIILLDCGIKAEQRINNRKEWLDISLINLYEGYEDENDFELMFKLFLELHTKGFKGKGMSREVGYYDSTDDIILKCSRDIK